MLVLSAVVWFWWVTCVAASFISNVYQASSEHPLTKIDVDPNSGQLFVGGKNVLLNLFPNLTEKQPPIPSGPLNESYGDDCAGPTDKSCSIRQSDNYASVLLIYPDNKVLVCGSALNGLCFVHAKTNLSEKFAMRSYITGGYHDDNLLGSSDRRNVVVLLSEQGTGSFTDINIHYVAKTYDQKPTAFHSHIFALLRLKDSARGYYFDDLADIGMREGKAYMNMNESLAETLSMDMIYGFETEEYVYFIFNRYFISDLDKTEARIARIKKNCSSKTFQTYVEVPIRCHDEQGHYSYQMAFAAYSHTDPYGNRTLFVAFNDDADGSNVCAFSEKDHLARKGFLPTMVNCYNGYDIQHPIWSSKESYCSNKINHPGWTECGNAEYHGIESDYNIDKVRLFNIPGKKAEILYVAQSTDSQEPVVVTGTGDGFFLKIKVDRAFAASDLSRQYARYDVTGDRSLPIQRSYGVDLNKQHLFLLAGRKVMKIPLFSCGIHIDCQSCMESNDPRGCGWCGNKCTSAGDCAGNFTWNQKSCPPEIYKIFPDNGTTDGKTKIAIYGRYFAWGQQIRVELGGYECTVAQYNDSRITCETTPTKGGIEVPDAPVVVETINGTVMRSYSNVTFDYLIPEIIDFSPKHGPRSGSTYLTITGQNLNVGSSLAIYVSDSESGCDVERKSNGTIVCVLRQWTSTNTEGKQSSDRNCLGVGPVKVEIDKLMITSDRDYCYMKDPVITNIAPLATTIRGGRMVSVVGQHFDAISISQLKVVVENSGSFTEMCSVITPDLLQCQYPKVGNVLDSQSNGKSGVLHILLDGRTNDNPKKIMIYKDPVFKRVTNDTLEQDKTTFVIKGKYLDLVFKDTDFNITIDGKNCPISRLTTEQIECDMSDILDTLEKDKLYEVSVSVGPIWEMLGYLKVQHDYSTEKLLQAGDHRWLFVAIGLVLLCILCGVFCIMKIKKVGPWKRKRRDYPINSDLEDNMTFQNLMRVENDEPSSVPNTYTHIGCEDGAMGGSDPNKLFVDISTIDMLKKENLLISRDNLLLGEDVGHGQFGCVYKGYLSNPGEKAERLVAVKTILKSSEASIGEFLNEALIMKDFNHPNVLSLVGVCMDKGEFPLVILPFMENGDLLAFIRDERNMPLVKDLVIFGMDIAKGMDYLSGIKFVHRDLAARNCMLDDQFIAKVADFGLSRDIYSSHYYSSDNKKKLPVKWMAPESLEKGKYTAKSDVWSFGVVLWELITRGANPYAAVDNWDMYTYLKDGRRLPKPQFCPPRLYNMMISCWEFNPSRRPTFRDLTKEIKRLLKESEKEENSMCDVTLDLESATSIA